MRDHELNTVLKAYSETWRRYISPPAMQGPEPVLSKQARAAINRLEAEASRVPDPGGPISNYTNALAAWAASSHPEIDWPEMYRHVLDRLMFERFW